MLLNICQLSVQFTLSQKLLPALNKVNLALEHSSTTAVIGETGCGKSVLAAAITGLLPADAHMQGTIIWRNKPLTPALLQDIRGRQLTLIPQNALASLNPLLTAGFQLSEAVVRNIPKLTKDQAYRHSLELLAAVGLNDARTIYHSYPHQLSGGMAQRVLLAAVISGNSQLIIADEPTTGLDIATRNKNILLLHQVCENSALFLITHDLEVAATCQTLVVMYAGEILETGPSVNVLTRPAHPYTSQLLHAHWRHGLTPIPGQHHRPDTGQPGCRFAPRCARWADLIKPAQEICLTDHPVLKSIDGDSTVRCWYA